MDGASVEWVYSDEPPKLKAVLDTLIDLKPSLKPSLKRVSRNPNNLIIVTLRNRNRILGFMIIEKKPGSWTVKMHFNSKGTLYNVVLHESKRLEVELLPIRLKKDRL